MKEMLTWQSIDAGISYSNYTSKNVYVFLWRNLLKAQEHSIKVRYVGTTKSNKKVGMWAPKEKDMIYGITIWRSKDF